MSSVNSQNMRMRSNTVLCVAVAVLLNLTGSFGQQDVCGQAPLNTKIIGGGNAAAGSWPWQVHITFENVSCGGSLINKDWVLTAAMCIQSNDTSDIMIYLGHHNRQGPNPHEVNRTVIQVISHPNFNPNTVENNIALLRLSSSVDFTDYIKPVCLAADGSVFDEGLSSWVAGWGVLQDFTYPAVMQEVEISVVSNYKCNLAFYGEYNITDNMMCAGLLNAGGKGPCAGDLGVPLVSKQNSRWIQSGIASFGYCGNTIYIYIVYTRVSQYQDWINSHIVSNQPGFVTFTNKNTIDPTPFIAFPDIFSGSSPSLYLCPLSLTFCIISHLLSMFLKDEHI